VSLADARTLLPIAVTLALIQFMSVISLGRALSARHRYTIRPNRELLGIGAANLAGSLFRGIPVSASFSRSAVNDEAGACTPLANVVAAVLVGLTLLFLTPLFEFLPRTALSAIIIVSALGLIDVGELRTLFGTKRRDGAVALLTAAATLLIGVQEGIIVGVAASAVVVLYRVSRPHVAELGLLPGTHVFRDRGRFEDAEAVESVLVLRVDAAFSFFNAAYFRDYILRKSRQGSDVRAVVIDGSGINDLDTTAIEALRELVGTLKEWEIAFYLAGLKGPVRDILARSELSDALDSSCLQLTPYHAVRSVLERWDEAEGTERVQDYEARAEEDSADDDSEPAEDVRLT
jgi:SulP family sulfate permease